VLPPKYGQQVATCIEDVTKRHGRLTEAPQPFVVPDRSAAKDLVRLLGRLKAGGEFDPRASGRVMVATHLAEVRAPEPTLADAGREAFRRGPLTPDGRVHRVSRITL
jgi:hypothetical protein